MNWFPNFLLVVGVICFGLHLLAVSPPYENPNRGETEKLLGEIEAALTKYELNHGNYPVYTGIPAEGSAIILSSFRRDSDTTYLSEFFLKQNTQKIDDVELIVDAWGNPIRYRCEHPRTRPEDRTTYNPTYDIWSIGGPKGKKENLERWISNWATR